MSYKFPLPTPNKWKPHSTTSRCWINFRWHLRIRRSTRNPYKMRRRRHILAFISIAFALSGAAFGQRGPRLGMGRPHAGPGGPRARGEENLEKLSRMTPEQRRKALDHLPPERRRHIEDGVQRYQRLSPEAQAHLQD